MYRLYRLFFFDTADTRYRSDSDIFRQQLGFRFYYLAALLIFGTFSISLLKSKKNPLLNQTMDDSTISLTDAELYQIAIHEAGHLVAYYLLFGNIDIIQSVSAGIRDGERNLGRVKEDSGAKLKEAFNLYYEDEEGFYKVGGYAFKECCYSLAGVITDKIFLSLDHIPFTHSCDDWFSIKGWLDNFPGDDSIIDSLVEAAIPETEKLVYANFDYIRKVADAIIAAPNHELDNPSLNALLER